MKEIYDWVPWFRELAKKIEAGGEEYLIEKAKEVKWGKSRRLLEYGDENIDPFSFFYFLAQRNTVNQRKPVYASVHEVFSISDNLPEPGREGLYNHPTPPPFAPVLFYKGTEFNSDLLWELFRQAVKSTKDKLAIQPENFNGALGINGVGVPKLTQCLSLINPDSFIPIHDVPAQNETKKRIETGKWGAYCEALGDTMGKFPECHFYEVGQVYYRLSKKISLRQIFYQISTNVYNDGKDYWSDFKENNWVYTGGLGSDEYPYPLEDPKPGDIILVRTGEYRGRAIGIVEKNDYVDKGYNVDGKIHVLWINKTENEFPTRTGVRVGFSKVGADYEIYKSFRNITKYLPTFEFIESLTKNSIVLRTVEDKSQVIENAKSFNKLTTTSDSYVYKVFNNFTHWYYFKESGIFAPSKFIGYENTTIENYRRGEGRDGRETENVLKNWFHPLEQGATNFDVLSKKLHQYVNSLHRKVRKGYVIHIENDPESHPVSQEQEPKIMEHHHPLNQILFGPPGTGKTWNTVNHAVAIIDDEAVDDLINKNRNEIKKRFNKLKEDGLIGMVTFHQNYSYEDFIEGIRPVLSGKQETEDGEQGDKRDIKYELSEGIFKRIANCAEKNREQNYVLIIDEINRGNIAKIFGELITLIEKSKRLGNDDEATTVLPYSKKSFGVPNNLYIVGTMNTADRSIALLDTALRRRFDFVEIMPDPKHSGISTNIERVNCQKLLEKINERICVLHDRDHQIGHTYLLNVKNIDSLAKTFQNRIIPLLQEYFYDNWEKIDLVLNKNGFIQERDLGKSLFRSSDPVDAERKIYELLSADNDMWQTADSYIKIYQTETKPTKEDQDNSPASD